MQVHHRNDLDLFGFHSKDDRVGKFANADLSEVGIKSALAFRISTGTSDGVAQRRLEQGCLMRIVLFNVCGSLKCFGVSLRVKTERKHDTSSHGFETLEKVVSVGQLHLALVDLTCPVFDLFGPFRTDGFA